MKILITSGGTKIPIDPVRYIANGSGGSMGASIAKEFLLDKHEVHFLCADRSKTPLDFRANLKDLQDLGELGRKFRAFQEFAYIHKHQYCEYKYGTFEDYYKQLCDLLLSLKPDITVLCAAVSDYGIVPSSAKIRTKDQLNLSLYELPKVISKVKDILPNTFLVGFKLLTNTTDEELIFNAQKSIENNKCDLVIANDWALANKEVILVSKNNSVKYKENIQKSIVSEIIKLKNNFEQ